MLNLILDFFFFSSSSSSCSSSGKTPLTASKNMWLQRMFRSYPFVIICFLYQLINLHERCQEHVAVEQEHESSASFSILSIHESMSRTRRSTYLPSLRPISNGNGNGMSESMGWLRRSSVMGERGGGLRLGELLLRVSQLADGFVLSGSLAAAGKWWSGFVSRSMRRCWLIVRPAEKKSKFG